MVQLSNCRLTKQDVEIYRCSFFHRWTDGFRKLAFLLWLLGLARIDSDWCYLCLALLMFSSSVLRSQTVNYHDNRCKKKQNSAAIITTFLSPLKLMTLLRKMQFAFSLS